MTPESGFLSVMMVLIETVGTAQMEVGSSNAQEAKRVYNAERFRSQEGNPCETVCSQSGRHIVRKLVCSTAIFALAGLYCLQSARAVKDEPASQSVAGPPTIVFMTDFGIQEDSVAICKGVMWSITPTARIVDVTHRELAHDPAHISPQSIEKGARLLVATTPYYPAGTVFLAIINPHVGANRKPVVVKSKRGQYFVLPDNGLITLVQDRDGIEGTREISNASWMTGDALSSSFEGRDIFSSVAAHLARGDDWVQVGPDVKDLVRIRSSAVRLDGSGIKGEAIDLWEPYGNVVTNISGDDFRKLGYDFGQNVPVTLVNTKKELLVPFVRTFSDVGANKPLLFIDSRSGHLVLAINNGNFARTYGATPGQPILVAGKK
jgi:S-adenosyl-L-methionine hydrolase (adenosine-forming)